LKKYRTKNYKLPIVEIEVEWETRDFWFLPEGRRVNKYSNYEQYFDTINAAKNAILANLKSEIDDKQLEVNDELYKLGLLKDKYKALKEELGFE